MLVGAGHRLDPAMPEWSTKLCKPGTIGFVVHFADEIFRLS